MPTNSQIALVALIAVVATVDARPEAFRNRAVLLLVDSEAVESMLVAGYSARQDLCLLVGYFWEKCAELDALVYVDRVPTDANLADGPSRGDRSISDQLGWEEAPVKWPKTRTRAWETVDLTLSEPGSPRLPADRATNPRRQKRGS